MVPVEVVVVVTRKGSDGRGGGHVRHVRMVARVKVNLDWVPFSSSVSDSGQ